MKKVHVDIRKSRIHGHGVFAQRPIGHGQLIRDGHLPRRRNFRGFNHSCDPNTLLVFVTPRQMLVVSMREIRVGEELTVNYMRGRMRRPFFPCNCKICRKK